MPTEYICEVSGRRYKTARGAIESAKRERLRSYQRNYVRLNAGTAQRILDLMVEKSKEFYGWDMKLEIKNSSFDYWQSQKKHIKDKILTVEAHMELSINKEKGRRKKMCYFISEHFEGVHSSFSFEEVKHFSIPGACKTIRFQLTLGDFPKLLENYEKFLEQQSKYHEFVDKKRKANSDAKQFVETRSDYRELWEHKERIEKMLQSHQVEMKKMFDYYQDGYMRLWECSNGKAPEIDAELSETFS
jgi:hypothetical protein